MKPRQPRPSPFERTGEPAVLGDPPLKYYFVLAEEPALEVLLQGAARHRQREWISLASNAINNYANETARRPHEEIGQRIDGSHVRDALAVD